MDHHNNLGKFLTVSLVVYLILVIIFAGINTGLTLVPLLPGYWIRDAFMTILSLIGISFALVTLLTQNTLYLLGHLLFLFIIIGYYLLEANKLNLIPKWSPDNATLKEIILNGYGIYYHSFDVNESIDNLIKNIAQNYVFRLKMVLVLRSVSVIPVLGFLASDYCIRIWRTVFPRTPANVGLHDTRTPRPANSIHIFSETSSL